MVKNRGNGEFLLKQVQPVVQGSREPAGQLAEKSIPRTNRLQERAAEVAGYILVAGGRMAVSELERQIRGSPSAAFLRCSRNGSQLEMVTSR